MRLSSLLMFECIKFPHINEIMGFSDHCFAFYIGDRKQYTSIMVLIPILLTYMVCAKVWFQVVTYSLHILVVCMGDKYSKLHHFADDSSLNFSSSIKLINKQVNDNFKVNSLA